MPTVKIELLKGKNKEALFQIRDSVMDSVVEVLQLPANDRNIRLIEYETGMFEMKPPYEILIEISMFSGRTKETKKKLFQKIVNTLDEKGLIEKQNILVTLNEQAMENWGVRGGMPADEMDLGFKVEV